METVHTFWMYCFGRTGAVSRSARVVALCDAWRSCAWASEALTDALEIWDATLREPNCFWRGSCDEDGLPAPAAERPRSIYLWWSFLLARVSRQRPRAFFISSL